MDLRKYFLRLFVFCLILVAVLPAELSAQGDMSEFAATLEVLSPGVEVRRVNTVNWITVQVEAIVGVGDVIRTDETGRARVTFFEDGVDTELQPETEFTIDRFEGNDESFHLSTSVLAGQTMQRILRLLDAQSSYDINTPGMALTIRGTQLALRIEPDGRSAMLVFEGTAGAQSNDDDAAVPAGFGVRAPQSGGLSDVVAATTFEELDSALDGCEAEVRTLDDVRLNVRLGPSLTLPRVGTLDATDIDLFLGVSAAGSWYRVAFNGGFGWVLSSDNTVTSSCAGLRVFPDTFVEDPTTYESLGESIDLEDLLDSMPEATPAATPSATPVPASG